MTPEAFIAKWTRANLSERSASQQHFLDLCDLLRQPKPAESDPEGENYTFERGARKTGGGDGWADVWKRGHFAWEYKGKRKNLDVAYQQLLEYREALENPPLLVVCDLDRFQIHTNFTGTAKRVYEFGLADLAVPANLDVLRRVFTDPDSLRPDAATERLTEEAVERFRVLAKGLSDRGAPPAEAAHFLMKLVFCFFAEDIGLLPSGLFSSFLERGSKDPAWLAQRLRALFEVMCKGGDFGRDRIAYFDGGLFADAQVFELRPDEVNSLAEVSRYEWQHIEPSIFGTLFERLLDPAKRAQIGAHYTSRQDILTLVEPVLMAPLRREWAGAREKCEKITADLKGAESAKRKRVAERERILQSFVESLADVRVLDPACGSGNFLYVSLHQLLDLEKEVITFAAQFKVGLFPHVHPRQLGGVEINPFAQELASVVIWIGYLQWMHHHGFKLPDNPVLEPLVSIQRMDAVLDFSDPKKPSEPDWPEADVIVGNPPFLGGKQLRKNLGDAYIDALFDVWSERVPREADLCCYWFEKARDLVQRGKVNRVGLLATQGIRGGANREVVEQVKETGDIFFAVSDREWVLDGANVHVSMIGFDKGSEAERVLDGRAVTAINADLTSGSDLTSARTLKENLGISFMGDTKGGAFEVSGAIASEWLEAYNANRRSNSEVLRPWLNGADLIGQPRGMWIVDFGCDMSLEEAAGFEAPMAHVRSHVLPEREATQRAEYRELWWLHTRPRPAMRRALAPLKRYVATPNLTKHRLFAFLDSRVLADHQLIAFARDDDYFFGVVQSAVHERWALRMGTALEDRPRYTPTTCFETFPFPPGAGGLGARVEAGQARELRERIARAAARLNELREAWLHPQAAAGAEGIAAKELRKRTLTNLYNERPTWLELAHIDLDRAVLAAYGLPEAWAEGLQPKREASKPVNPTDGVRDPQVEQDLLAKLLALNLEQAGRQV